MWSTAKISGACILFGLSFLSALAPCIMVRCLVGRLGISSRFKRVISILNCFAGGVFFATSVMDLLPEAREAMEEMFTIRDYEGEFPLTECIMGVGFLFILFLEQLALRCFTRGHTSHHTTSHVTSQANHHSEMSTSLSCTQKVPFVPNGSPTDDVIITRDLDDSTCIDDIKRPKYGSFDGLDATNKHRTWTHEKDPNLALPKPQFDSNGACRDMCHVDVEIRGETHEPHDNQVEAGVALQLTQKKADRRVFVLRSLTLLGALSIHMVFDGLALGLLNDETDIWQVTLALSIHKSLVFFTIGLQLLELLGSVPKTVIAIFIFALLSPLGVLIGELVVSNGDDLTRITVTAILQSIATGTFIYVTFFEILQRELNVGDHDLLKVLATVFGFALIGVVKYFTHEA